MKGFVLVLLSGCSLGLGSPYVGEWRPRQRVDMESCLVDDAGNCREHEDVIVSEPARSYWGAIVQYPAIGVASNNRSGAGVFLEGSLELLKGHGAYAVGLRGSAVWDQEATAFPFDVIGHLSLAEHLGIYAGAGFSPYARLKLDDVLETTRTGERVLVGAQLALSPRFVLSVEADSLWLGFDGGYRSLALYGQLGLFI